jgi:hypothetical protein
VTRRPWPERPSCQIDEGYVRECQQIGDRQRRAPVNVEIKDGAVDVATLNDALYLGRHGRRPDDAIARFAQQTLQVERYDGIVDN